MTTLLMSLEAGRSRAGGGERLAEVQGLYGPVSIPESLLQKIWLRGDFARAGLRTAGGGALELVSRGTWNLQEGPDFKDAEIVVDGERLVGDIEVHFYARDWDGHGHDRNPGFDRVVLHVVLFEPEPFERARRSCGGEVPHTLVLLPLLDQDLETYAMDEALLTLERREHEEVLAPLLALPPASRRRQLREKARLRWEQKVAFARGRLEKGGWDEACHQSLLEVLGYRRNRAPMLDLAHRFPLAEMAGDHRGADYYFALLEGSWKLAGLRPANHPRRRLEQYLDLLRENPRWPDYLERRFGRRWPTAETATAAFRRENEVAGLRAELAEKVLCSAVGGSRLDTLCCDAFLPLLAARTGQDLYPFWFHWFGGDVPDLLHRFLRAAGVTDGRHHPNCNGFNQAGLQLLIDG